MHLINQKSFYNIVYYSILSIKKLIYNKIPHTLQKIFNN